MTVFRPTISRLVSNSRRFDALVSQCGKDMMKLDNNHEFFNGLCDGCNAAVKQEDVDPDKLYLQWLCPRCRAELEQLPLRHKTVFDKLKRKIEDVEGNVKYLNGKIAILEGFIVAHGLDPQAADDSYALSALSGVKRSAGDVRLICSKCGACAGHPEDRVGDKCRHCGGRAIVAQERGSSGARRVLG